MIFPPPDKVASAEQTVSLRLRLGCCAPDCSPGVTEFWGDEFEADSAVLVVRFRNRAYGIRLGGLASSHPR